MTNLTFSKDLLVDADHEDEIELEGVSPADVIQQLIWDFEGPDEEVWELHIHALKLALLICEGGTAVDKMVDEMEAIARCLVQSGRANSVTIHMSSVWGIVTRIRDQMRRLAPGSY